jgi:predicted kinase
MIVLLNGAFGIGKSTVARRLRARLPGGVIFDPEWIGSAFRLAPWLRGGDYQDLLAWRRLTVWGIGSARALRPTVIVPMAFSDPTYLEEISAGARRFDADVRRFCLIAPLEVVRERLERRALETRRPAGDWMRRRAAECCAVHGDAAFSDQVPALGGPDEVASDIVARLAAPGRP